jgi:hypothetical protein
MAWSVDDLVATLLASEESSYVRVVADWLVHGEVGFTPPARSGERIVDALAAAAVAHLARTQGQAPPAWTRAHDRLLDAFWHPGGDRFFAYSLAHAPAEFAARGVIVERDSLVSV